MSFPGCSAPWSKVNHPRPGVRHGRENGKRKPYISPHGYPPWPTKVNHRPSIRIVHTIHCCVIPSRRAWFLFLFPSQTWSWRSSAPSPRKILCAERHVAGKQCRYSNNNRTCDAACDFGHSYGEKVRIGGGRWLPWGRGGMGVTTEMRHTFLGQPRGMRPRHHPRGRATREGGQVA